MNYLKYGILGLLFGIFATYGAWAILEFTSDMTSLTQVLMANNTLLPIANSSKTVATIAIITILTEILGFILDKIFHKAE
jgi:hypothetical protein